MNAPFTNPQIIRLNFTPEKKTPPASKFAAPKPGGGGWSLNRWILFIGLIFFAHVAAIFIFVEHKFPAPFPVTKAVQFQLAGNSSEMLALDNPTLFALPRAGDLASVGLQIPATEPPVFRWSDSPHLLPLPAQMLGAAFHQFMQTNFAQNVSLNFKPQPEFSAPAISLQPVFGAHSTLQIEGDLALRKLAGEITLPNWPYADVIAPSHVQVLVNEDGSVVSAVPLPLNSPLKNEIRYDAADQRALEIARGLQFAPAPHLTVGNIVFNWRTVPLPETNSVAGQ